VRRLAVFVLAIGTSTSKGADASRPHRIGLIEDA
jgi:hypothetical protein